ncbi:MAG: DUF4160 domain-containing protein [Bacteroidota bacterium]
MACIKSIDSIKIFIYPRDHNPPHFHVIYAEYEMMIEIKTLTKMLGELPKKQEKKVLEWARANQDFIYKKWKQYNPDK